MLQRTGEAETITTHYLFALGAYRALYIPNWLYRYFADGWSDPIAVVAGIVQTVLYSDFFWIYYTKSVILGNSYHTKADIAILQGAQGQEIFTARMSLQLEQPKASRSNGRTDHSGCNLRTQACAAGNFQRLLD